LEAAIDNHATGHLSFSRFLRGAEPVIADALDAAALKAAAT